MSQQIYKSIAAIMREVGAIGKDRKNEQQRFKFRSIDDIYNRLQPLLAKHGVFSAPQVLEMEHETGKTAKGGTMFHLWCRVQYTFFAEDGSSVEVVTIGESMDSGDKSGNKAMAAAHKYALSQVFSIPYEDMDPDEFTPEAYRNASNRITQDQYKEIKSGWWSIHKPELEGVPQEHVKERFNEWVRESTGTELSFDYSNWKNWMKDDYAKCREKLEEYASEALGESGLAATATE